jgi:hypothetical protein
MNEFALIVHGAWFDAGEPSDEGLFEIPDGLTIKTYGLQNTSLPKATARLILEMLMKNSQSLGLVHGENFINSTKVVYKEYEKGAPSSVISNYSLSGENDDLLGLYTINPPKKTVELPGGFRSRLKEFIDKNRITGVLHLLCCQGFK